MPAPVDGSGQAAEPSALAGLDFGALEEEEPESEPEDALDDEAPDDEAPDDPEPESLELAGGTEADEPLRESVR